MTRWISAFFLLTSVSCASLQNQDETNKRLDYMENRQNYVFEVLKQRRLSPERCAEFTNTDLAISLNQFGMICETAPNGGCACNFVPDEQDRENTAIDEATEREEAKKEKKEKKTE